MSEEKTSQLKAKKPRKASKRSTQAPLVKPRREDMKFAAVSQIAITRGDVCSAQVALRIPQGLKDKLAERPSWQEEVRQFLIQMVGY
jgi:hypothetical protein